MGPDREDSAARSIESKDSDLKVACKVYGRGLNNYKFHDPVFLV